MYLAGMQGGRDRRHSSRWSANVMRSGSKQGSRQGREGSDMKWPSFRGISCSAHTWRGKPRALVQFPVAMTLLEGGGGWRGRAGGQLKRVQHGINIPPPLRRAGCHARRHERRGGSSGGQQAGLGGLLPRHCVQVLLRDGCVLGQDLPELVAADALPLQQHLCHSIHLHDSSNSRVGTVSS